MMMAAAAHVGYSLGQRRHVSAPSQSRSDLDEVTTFSLLNTRRSTRRQRGLWATRGAACVVTGILAVLHTPASAAKFLPPMPLLVQACDTIWIFDGIAVIHHWYTRRRYSLRIVSPLANDFHFSSKTNAFAVCCSMLPVLFPTAVTQKLRMLRALRTWGLLNKVEMRLMLWLDCRPRTVHLTNLCGILFVAMHVVGCMWSELHESDAFGPPPWYVPRTCLEEASTHMRPSPYSLAVFLALCYSSSAPNIRMTALPTSERYAHALYYALGALTGYGDLGSPKSPAEILFAATTIVIGLALFASIVGGISEALGSGQSETTRFLEGIEAVNELMKQEDLPVHLRQRIDAVFEHEYDKLLANDGAPHWSDLTGALDVLPRYLRDEVVGQIAIDTIHIVPLFQSVDHTVCAHLARCLKAEFVLSGDILFHQGDLGRCMYFVRSGTLDVIVRGLGKVASLVAGDYVGEMSILFEEPRTATVRATSDCELLLLEKDALHRELGALPDVLADMKATATERKLSDNVSEMPRATGTQRTSIADIGDHVMHPTRGKGIVVAIEPDEAGKMRTHVHFNASGELHRYLQRSWHKLQLGDVSARAPAGVEKTPRRRSNRLAQRR